MKKLNLVSLHIRRLGTKVPLVLLINLFSTACLVEPASTDGDDFLLGLAAGAANTTTVTNTDTGNTGTTTTTTVNSVTDNGDGTITSVLNGITRMFPKCVQDNTASGNRYGGGGAADTCTTGAVGTLQYCSTSDNSCNGGTNSGQLDGGGTSAIYTSCDGLSLGGHTDWRVPTTAELSSFFRDVYLVQPGMLPGLFAGVHWSSISFDSLNGSQLNFATGIFTTASKTAVYRVYCIRIP